MSSPWADVLDSLAAQLDLQERCVRLGHDAPADLEIDPPDLPITGDDRLRALELFERGEALALVAAKHLAQSRARPRSAYT